MKKFHSLISFRQSIEIRCYKRSLTIYKSDKPFWQRYEDFIGLSEVKAAQEIVKKAEEDFAITQINRRDKQQQLNLITSKLKSLQVDIERTNRTDSKYIKLVTEEHEILRALDSQHRDVEYLERVERDNFTALSAAVRESHERERARAERTKYWSVLASVVGTFFGIVGTSISHYFRQQEFRLALNDSIERTTATHSLVSNLAAAFDVQRVATHHMLVGLRSVVAGGEATQTPVAVDAIQNFTEQPSHEALPDFKPVAVSTPPPLDRLEAQSTSIHSLCERIMHSVTEQDRLLRDELGLLTQRIQTQTVTAADEAVYIVGNERLEGLLDRTTSNLEYKMKLNSLATVTMVYGVLAIAGPLVYHLFFQS